MEDKVEELANKKLEILRKKLYAEYDLNVKKLKEDTLAFETEKREF